MKIIKLNFESLLFQGGRRVIGIFRSLMWSKTLTELIFNPCDEFRRSPEDPVSQIHSPSLHAGVPGSFKMPKREWGAKSYGKLPRLFILSKTATLVPEFVVEDLPLGRTPGLVPESAVNELPLGRTL